MNRNNPNPTNRTSRNTGTEGTPSAKGKLPTYVAFHVREGQNGGFWTRIGAAWEHNDGKGLNIQVDAVPLDGRITLRVPSEEPKQ